MKTNNGYIVISRSILEWRWFKNHNTFKLFIYLILKANIIDNEFELITIKRGELVTSVKSLSQALNLSEQNIKTSLKQLKLTNEITIKTTNKYSIITICNYDTYQNQKNYSNKRTNKQTNKQLTNNQQTTNKQLTNNQQQYNNINMEEYNNEKNKDNICQNLENLDNVNNLFDDKDSIEEIQEITKKQAKAIFDDARKLFKGVKRGLDTEFNDYTKKRGSETDWKQTINLLIPAIKREIEYKEKLAMAGEFVPEWKNFKTWISQRCWEQEFFDKNRNNNNDEEIKRKNDKIKNYFGEFNK